MRRHEPWAVILASAPLGQLQTTLQRAREVSAPPRILVVVTAGDVARMDGALAGLGVELAVQPRDLGTGPAVLFALSKIRVRDPEAHVLVMPADQQVDQPERFVQAMRQAARASARGHERFAVLGAIPDGPGRDLGWIVPGRPLGTVSGRGAFSIARFANPPEGALAETLRAGGALWDTGVVAVKIGPLWALAERHLPAHAQAFARYQAALGGPQADAVLAEIYRTAAPADLTADLLQHAPHLAVVRLDGIAWSDSRCAALLPSPLPLPLAG